MATPSRSRRNATMPRYELWQISASPTITWRSQILLIVSSNSTASSRVVAVKASSSATSALWLLVDELAAHAMSNRQIADCRRSCQHLDGQVLAVILRQHHRCADASSHMAPPLKTSQCRHPPWRRQPSFACDPDLNHVRRCLCGTDGSAHTIWPRCY